MSDLVAKAITEVFGERCPDFEPECHCCKAWAEFDRITTLEAELEKAREAAFEEAAKVAEAARFEHDDSNQPGDDDWWSTEIANGQAAQIATAIRALSQDKEARE